jgi:hypothetical protein
VAPSRPGVQGAPAASSAARSFASGPDFRLSSSCRTADSSVRAISTSRRCVAVGGCRVSHVLMAGYTRPEIDGASDSFSRPRAGSPLSRRLSPAIVALTSSICRNSPASAFGVAMTAARMCRSSSRMRPSA